MSVEQPAFSFDKAQPPTPSRTPTSPAFDSSFQTPKFESSFYDERVTWNTADPNAASPNLLRTPRPITFNTPRPDKSPNFFDTVQFNQENIPSGAGTNAQLIPSTPSLQSRPPNQSPGVGYTPNFGVEPQSTSPQKGLTLDTSNSFGSAGSLQTPPPTGTSAEKRQGRKAKAPKPSQTAKSAASRRMSMPLAPKTDNHGNSTSQAEEAPQQFASLDFSPDVLGYNFAAPATAPAYPQHKLFWDTGVDATAGLDFGQDIANPFDNTQAGALGGFPDNGQFSTQAANDTSFLDFNNPANAVPSFLQTNTGNPGQQLQNSTNEFSQNYNGVDPSLLFSSPTKLPEPPAGPVGQPRLLTEESLQPYAHQLQEAKRDKSYGGIGKSKKRRKPSVDSPAVKAALENLREESDARPAIRRSMTDSFIPGANRPSSSSRPGSIHGRSSPLKRNRDSMQRPKSRPSVSLTIDENGRARLVEAAKGPNGDQMDLDSQSDSSSSDESINVDEMMVTSFNSRSTMPKLGRFSSSAPHSQKSSNTSLYSDSQPSLPDLKSRPTTSASAPHQRIYGLPPLKPLREATSMEEEAASEAETIMDSEDGEDLNAQSQLRKVMRNRGEVGRSSRPKHHVYSPQSKQGAYFGSQNDAFLSNLSPTTMTDPDLATPSSATSAASDSIRCICNNAGDDGQMIQCESCRKWLHVPCTGVNPSRLPPIYLCLFCTGQTPTVRGGRVRDPSRKAPHASSSPLAQKAPRFR